MIKPDFNSLLIDALPSVQPEKRTEERTETHACDLISRQEAIEVLAKFVPYAICDASTESYTNGLTDAYNLICQLPSAQPEIVRCKDCKYGEQDEVGRWFCRSLGCQIGNEDGSGYCADAERRTDNANATLDDAVTVARRTCVNCGRTVNNGGWYADGRTRCPIEEHYVLPKDGYCHLWEKRNVTDDDYPERREK